MPRGSTRPGLPSSSWRTKRVESRKWETRAGSLPAPQSEASIVNAPKHEAEGVTISPWEFRRAALSFEDNSTALAKSPALAATRPQHHWSLGKPTLNPAAVAMRSRATHASGHDLSARPEAKIVSGSPSTWWSCTRSRYGEPASRGVPGTRPLNGPVG